MSAHEPIDPGDVEDSWGVSVTEELEKSRSRAWMIAAAAAVIAVLEALALVLLIPLKTVEPYTLLVDRQTGNVETLAPLDAQVIAPDAALTRSFLVQYVIARESFDYANLQADYRKVALWSAGEARQRYVDMMRTGSPTSPVSIYPRNARVGVEVRSVSSLGAGRSLVRFTTVRTDLGGQPQEAQHWAAVVDYTFTDAEMSEEDRYLNPLGFQVTRYRRDAETLPEAIEPAPPAQTQTQPQPQTQPLPMQLPAEPTP